MPLASFALLAFVVLTISRLLLARDHASHLQPGGGLGEILSRAWRFDLATVCAVLLVVAVVQWLAPGSLLRSAAWRRGMAAWLTAWLMLIVWNEAATPDFISEFGVRPNRLYVEYLGSPRVVFSTLWNAHRTALLAGLLLTSATGAMAWRLFHRPPAHVAPLPMRLAVLFPLALALFIGLRGGVGHRPLSISAATVSADALANELALNSTYSSLYALYRLRKESDQLVAYQAVPEAEVLQQVRAGMQLPAAAFSDPSHPSRHALVPGAHPATMPNLVILLQESLGAHYFESLGGEPVVQRLESWRGRSLWFDQLYATGTRSARGLEAVVTGFLPTRAPSVLKLEGAQHGFSSLASVLKPEGYYSEFIYGGDSNFDNMRRFFLGNGFDRVIDSAELAPQAAFQTTWGVSDEDLYQRVEREMAEHAGHGKPFFALVFSTSNHPPYAFPEGRITPYEAPLNTANNAARYADFAVGRFLERARQSPRWQDTIFVVVADHESRTVGEGLVPVFSFHIPGFIAGGPVRPQVITRLASQIDLAPTVLSLMGLNVRVPMPGIDQTRADLVGPGRAIMQFHDSAALRIGNDVEILVPGQAPRHFTVNGMALQPAPADSGLERQVLAYTEWPVMAYAAGWYL